MKKIITLLMALTMCAAIHAQEIEKLDKFPSGYINGVFMGEAKFKTVDGVLYAVGYEGTRDWILVRYPAGSRNESYTVHPYCRRIARGAFQGAAYLKEIYIPSTVSYIGDDAFADCTSLTGIYFGETGEEGSHTGVRSAETSHDSDAGEVARYNLSGRPCTPSDKGVQIIVYSDYTTRTVIED
jgi:hypothetical protein